VSARPLTASILCLAASVVLGAQSVGPARPEKSTAPESFRINGQVLDTPGGVAASMTLQIDAYTPDDRNQTIVGTLKAGDNAAFLEVLRKSPVVGSLKMGDRSVPIRWARSQPQQNGNRRVAVMTESPVFFFGAGAVDAKPTAGYDVGVLEFTIDSVGMGKGTMAAAAKVKPGGPTGIQIDDYSGKRIELTTVTRNAK
jgi:hypothetical protein